MTAAEIRSAARRAGAEATAENVIARTGPAAALWLEGFIAGIEASQALSDRTNPDYVTPGEAIEGLLERAIEAAKTVSEP